MAGTDKGYLLIADITGYTQYLSESELEHANGVLKALLELLITHTRPPLVISRLAGDAVISYGLEDHFLSGQAFVEMIEETYVAFRRAIDRMVLNNTCRCNACANVGTLDLKFFVHHGEFLRQRLDKHDELLGAEVIVIHRMLKNTVAEKAGTRAYALYSDAAIRRLGIDPVEAGLRAHEEVYEHLGTVQLWVADMRPVWEERGATVRIEVAPENVMIAVSAEVALAPEVTWSYLVEPEHRKLIMGVDRYEVVGRKGGRLAVGTEYQCFHGKGHTPQVVVEWIPFERIVTEDRLPLPGESFLIGDYRIERTERGSRLYQVLAWSRGPWWARLMARAIMATMRGRAQRDLDRFARHVEEDAARCGLEAQAPGLPPSVEELRALPAAVGGVPSPG